MVREDILGGLSSALARGQSLKQAMMSFYNAGYLKQEIEEAARFLKSGGNQMMQQPAQTQNQQVLQVQPQTQKVKQNVSSYETTQFKQPQQKPQQQAQNQMPAQNVSQYPNQKQNPKGKLVMAVLGVVLFFLLASFAGVFFFREEIIAFFSSP